MPNQGLEDALTALARLMDIFKAERILYLISAVVSMFLMLFAVFNIINKGASTQDLVILFGSSGVTGLCSARVVLYLDKAFKIVESIINSSVLSKENEKVGGCNGQKYPGADPKPTKIFENDLPACAFRTDFGCWVTGI